MTSAQISEAPDRGPVRLTDCYRWINGTLSLQDRRQWKVLMCLSAFVGMFEALGVLSILPFLAIVADPEMLERPGLAARIYQAAPMDSVASFQIALGVLVFVVLVMGIALRMGRIVLHTRFARNQAVSLSLQLLRGCLHRPYRWFLDQNSAKISAGVLTEVERVVTGALTSSIELVANAVVVISVLAILFLADPVSALLITVILGGAYAGIVVATRLPLQKLGTQRLEANRVRYAIVSEALGGIKEVKLLGLEEPFLDLFETESEKAARARARIKQISELPRSALEILVFGVVLAFVLYVLARERNDLMAAIPIIGLFAFAGVRMFPVMQALYRAYSILFADSPALDALRRDLAAAPEPAPRDEAYDRLTLSRSIELCDIAFAYGDLSHSALRIEHAAIRAGEVTAIAGPSGSGKSTVVDIILGLLEPTLGRVLIDGTPLSHGNRAAWQANLGYVPQHVYLMDDSIAANIVFGRHRGDGPDRVRKAAKAAAIDDFVAGLPNGYDTRVGERGVRLSGGQAQRIAIARALFDDPQVLVLDEPTSALDTATEQSVLGSMTDTTSQRTVLIVTHRETTIQQCKNVLMLSGGRLVAAPEEEEESTEVPQ